jgi:hypothetical protein
MPDDFSLLQDAIFKMGYLGKITSYQDDYMTGHHVHELGKFRYTLDRCDRLRITHTIEDTETGFKVLYSSWNGQPETGLTYDKRFNLSRLFQKIGEVASHLEATANKDGCKSEQRRVDGYSFA